MSENTKKLYKGVSYLGLLFLIPLFAVKPEERTDDLKMHVNQGGLLFIITLIINVSNSFLGGFVGAIVTTCASVVGIVVFVLMVAAFCGKDICLNLPESCQFFWREG